MSTKPAVISDEIVKAYLEPSGAQTRSQLRKIVTDLYETDAENYLRSAMIDAVTLSGSAALGRGIRASFSGIRDALPMPTLWGLALQMVGFDEVLSTIRMNTGYDGALGRPSHLTDTELKKAMDAVQQAAKDHESMTTTHVAPAVASTPAVVDLSKVDAGARGILDSVLKGAGLPDLGQIDAVIKDLTSKVSGATHGVTIEFKGVAPAVPAGGGYPAGTMKTEKASTVFGIKGAAAALFDIDVPTFSWDSPHPLVPVLDTDYQFDPQSLLTYLWGLSTGQKIWLWGETGTGKSTFVEQVAARLNWPTIRVNFDSEITRMDLVGRDTLHQVAGTTTTKFVDGVLPTAMTMPCIFLADELDFIRSDVAYVFQRALEDRGLLITEDGGRLVTPHPMFRMVATANTRGNGDDTGRYLGARPQSAALLDRFTCWIKVDYMDQAALKKLLNAKTTLATSSSGMLDKFAAYAREHWTAFRNAEVLLPLSPRGILSSVWAYTAFKGLMKEDKAVKAAVEATIFERATEADRQTLKGLVQRTFGISL